MRSVRESNMPHDPSYLSRFVARLPPLVHSQRFGYVFGLAAVTAVTVLLELFLVQTRLGNASTIYALVVLVTAALYGRGPALATSAAAVVAFEHRQGTLENPTEWVTPIIF